MKILKFGGSSLESPDRISRVLDIINDVRGAGRLCVVVSAWGGVTDSLSEAARVSAQGGNRFRSLCKRLEDRHLDGIRALLDDKERQEILTLARERFRELRELLRGISMVGEFSPRTLDGILAFGERLSAPILAAALRQMGIPAEATDTRALILTDDHFGSARVEVEKTYPRIRKLFSSTNGIRVLTGFIGATEEGDTTTMGRGGSDLTAALVGAAVRAEIVELWTDVDGVMSADPRQVSNAFPLAYLSYEELMELSHFGAKVVYPASIHPARSAGIPILIKNTFNPGFAGTRIGSEASKDTYSIRGISSIREMALLRLEGDGMVGVPGIAMRLFGALGRRGINVILIGQASSEHSICFAVLPESVPGAVKEIANEFTLERRAGLIDDLVVEEHLSVIAVVGTQMRDRPGIAGRLFSVLGDRNINIRAIAQGSSELNISLVVSEKDEKRALNAIHDAFFSRAGRDCHLFVVGTGRVGGALLDQIGNQADRLREKLGFHFFLSGLSNSRRMQIHISPDGNRGWRDRLAGDNVQSQPADLDRLVRAVQESPGARIVVDCTAGDDVARHYRQLLESGVAVVTANKRPLAGSLNDYRKLLEPVPSGRPPLFYETTVGAGLPVLRTLRDLVATGDRIHRIDGVLSGTIGFLLDQVNRGVPFSLALREAHDKGFTEPDPREDLGGGDVGRKLLILAREAGLQLEADQVTVEPLSKTESLAPGSLEDFWSKIAAEDRDWEKKCEQSRKARKVLRYLARLEHSSARVALETIDANHPAASTSGTENMVAFYTDRYPENPLVIRGPGAGPEVTAAGVFADILAAAAVLGNR